MIDFSVSDLFIGIHFPLHSSENSSKWTKINSENEEVKASFSVQKHHRSNIESSAPRVLVITMKSLFILVDPGLSLKEQIPLSDIRGIYLFNLRYIN